MQFFGQRLKHKFRTVVYLPAVVFFVLVGSGCTSTQKTTKTEIASSSSNVEVTSAGSQGEISAVTTFPATQDTRTTTTTTETKPTGHPGILSSTVHAIGWVIALPFRLIGGLIGWIF